MHQTTARKAVSHSTGSSANEVSFHSNCQAEALARMHYLVNESRRVGLLTGPNGSGKSLLLAQFADECRQQRQTVVRLNLTGLSAEEFPWLLADGMGVRARRGASAVQIWQSIADQLLGLCYQKIHLVVLLDDADRADEAVLRTILRLIHLDPRSAEALTIVLVSEAGGLQRVSPHLLQLVELRIELFAWESEDTEQFLAQLAEADNAAIDFDPDAVARIHDLSEGLPRRVTQLAELSLVAARGQDLDCVNVETVELVDAELA